MTGCSGVDCKNCLEGVVEQPHGVEIFTADGVFIKQMAIPKAGTMVPQHSHVFDHTSMLARGSVRVWKDGVLDGDVVAPAGIFIAAGIKHAFLALEDETIIYCIHNISRIGNVEIAEEHQLKGADAEAHRG